MTDRCRNKVTSRSRANTHEDPGRVPASPKSIVGIFTIASIASTATPIAHVSNTQGEMAESQNLINVLWIKEDKAEAS